MKRVISKCLLIFFIIALFNSCGLFSPTISTYDAYAYGQTTSLKVDVLNLMDMASENYETHQQDIEKAKQELQKIYEYAKHRPKNEIVIKQWEILTDSSRVLGRFITKWKNDKTLGSTYIEDKKKNVAFIFDQIAELESKKIKQSDIKTN